MKNIDKLTKTVAWFKSDIDIQKKIDFMPKFLDLILEMEDDIKNKWGRQTLQTEKDRIAINRLCKEDNLNKDLLILYLNAIMVNCTDDKICHNNITKALGNYKEE